MRKTVAFIAGIAVGVYIARQVEANPEARRTLDQAGEKIKSFANAVSEGYREQEAKASKTAKLKSSK
jgi:uncharacterized membrane-anchored protein YhcB (DUF1043 family)